MMIADQVFAQAELLAGELDDAGRELLRLLCGAAVNTLRCQLREETSPEDIREEFVAAAGLYALAQWRRGRENGEFQEFRAGDLTVKQGATGSPESLETQALALLRPYRKNGFRFMGV